MGHRTIPEEENDYLHKQRFASREFHTNFTKLIHHSIESEGIVQAKRSSGGISITNWSKLEADKVCEDLVSSLTKGHRQMRKNRDITRLTILKISRQAVDDAARVNTASENYRLGTLIVTDNPTRDDVGWSPNQSGSTKDFKKRSQALNGQRDAMQPLAMDCNSTEFKEHVAACEVAGCGVVTISQASFDQLSPWLAHKELMLSLQEST